MHQTILSLDVDWFNYLEPGEIRGGIDSFFYQLKKTCSLPETIYLSQEHQYLYPWANTLSGYCQVSVVNIDEHHDFYCLNKIRFEDPNAKVSCGNFFAFMAHQSLLKEYVWVCGTLCVLDERKDLNKYLSGGSARVRRFGRTIRIFRQNEVFKALRGRKFNGFLIVKSPGYVIHKNTVYKAVNEALDSHFSKSTIKQCRRRRSFQLREMPKIANKYILD